MKHVIGLGTLSLVVSAMLVGCGGGSSTTPSTDTKNLSENSSPAVVEKATGYYVDEAIQGVEYKCGAEEGNTSSTGLFTFEKGVSCSFYLGGIKLREVNGSILQEDQLTILEDNQTVAQMLQSFDLDGNASNGIQLNHALLKDIFEENSIDTVPEEEAVLDMVVNELKVKDNNFTGKVITKEETENHLNETRDNLTQDGKRTQHDVEAENNNTNEFNQDQNHDNDRDEIKNENNETELPHAQNENSGNQEDADMNDGNMENQEHNSTQNTSQREESQDREMNNENNSTSETHRETNMENSENNTSTETHETDDMDRVQNNENNNSRNDRPRENHDEEDDDQ